MRWTETSLQLFRRGHLPVMGEWFALPLLEARGLEEASAIAMFDEIFHPISGGWSQVRRLLRIGGPSAGADEMVATGRKLGKTIYLALDEVPA